jgi:FkbM family methyltransferase
MSLKSSFQKLIRSVRKRVWFLRDKSVGSRPILSSLLGQAAATEGSKAMIDVGMMLKRHGITPRGVIHVGAHQAGELDDYLRLGFTKILYIEANPALMPALRVKASAHPGKVFVVHAAASDADGVVHLHVTSMDQSSSILPLGKHLEIYPFIREVARVEVRSRRLDTLLAEEGLSAADFNFLNLDIQGAELMALRGAPALLTGIAAVNTEINLAELYKGAALLGELEGFMAEAGFNRAAMMTPWHPTWGDAFYVRKPVVTMSTFGKNGRFANQLFQYMFLRLVAQRQGALVQTPAWAGQELFACDEPVPVLTFPDWREPVARLSSDDSLKGCEWTKHFREPAKEFRSVDYWGYFMGHTADLAPDQAFIRRLFRFVPEFVTTVDQRLAKLRSRRPRILAVHLRRGDYGRGYFFRAPCAWYEEWLRRSGFDPAEWIIYVCSETPGPYRQRFAGFQTADATELGGKADTAAYLDFYVLTQADYVLTANSSFSFMAAMLNEKAIGFARPCAEQEALVAFDPWDSHVMLRHTPTLEAHERMLAAD